MQDCIKLQKQKQYKEPLCRLPISSQLAGTLTGSIENMYLFKAPNIVLLTVLAGDGPLRTFLCQMTLKITF